MRRPAVALAAVVLATSCGTDARTQNRAGVAREEVVTAVAALCAMASTDDRAEAERRFEDDAHDTLHDIGDVVRERDPALAGRLLRAKARVETEIATGASPDAMRPDVRTLLDATTTAVEALGIEAPACGG